MPLSEQEQRLLEEMERSLYSSDGDDVATVGRRGRPNYTAIVLGVIAGIAGIILLVVAVSVRQPIVGLIGFAVMFGGALLAIAPPRRFTVPVEPAAGSSRPNRSFMDALNDRWERRADDEQR